MKAFFKELVAESAHSFMLIVAHVLIVWAVLILNAIVGG